MPDLSAHDVDASSAAPAGGTSTNTNGANNVSSESVSPQPNIDPIEEVVAGPPISTQVRFHRFAISNTQIFEQLLNMGYTAYSDMPLPTGLHDFIPDCLRFEGALHNEFARHVMNLETEVVTVRFHILHTYGHRLLEEKKAKEMHLESLTHYMLNLYLNKRNCPINFWVHDLKKGKV